MVCNSAENETSLACHGDVSLETPASERRKYAVISSDALQSDITLTSSQLRPYGELRCFDLTET